MKVGNFLLTLIVFAVTCDNVVKAQSCTSLDLDLGSIHYHAPAIKTRFVGSIVNFTIVNAVEATLSPGDFLKYFSIELVDEILIISTTNAYENYESEQNDIFPGIAIHFNCKSGTTTVVIKFIIEEANNFAPEFSKSNYEIMVPTPLPTGLDITYFMNDGEILAYDFDLYEKSLIFELSESNMFRVESIVDESGVKRKYKAKIITTQNILQIDGDEMTIYLDATDSSTTLARQTTRVSIKIISDPNNTFEGQLSVQFERSLYQGIFDEADGKLTIDNAIFNAQNFNENITFAISGIDSEYFERSSANNVVEISLKAGVSTEIIMQKAFYIFQLEALENGMKIASTNIMITTKEATTPKFDRTFYTGKVNQTLIHDLIRVDDADVIVSISDTTFFDITNSGTDVSVFLKPGAVIPAERKSFILTLMVKNQSTNKSSASVLFVTVESEKFEDKLEFSSILYEGKISKSFQLVHDTITLNNDSFTIVVTGKDFEFFSTTKNGNSVTLSLVNLENFPRDVSYLQITLTATADSFMSAQANVILGIERENSTDIDLSQPYFDTGFYFFSVLSIQTGIIGAIRARVPDGSQPGYTLLFEDSSLSNKLIVNAGDLILTEAIPVGTYKITAYALNAGKNATAELTLRVLEKLCKDDVLTTVEKSLAIVNLAENRFHNEIMYTKIDKCEFEILRVVPNTFRSYFTIDTATHYLKNTIPFDRESEEFSDEMVPQIEIILELNCNGTSEIVQPWLTSHVTTDEIMFSTSITHLLIIIEDINDNVPIITNPAIVDSKIGFPEDSLIEQLMPQYLIKIDAFDADEGINAKIKFSIDPSTYFDINPENGVVYPKQKFIDSTRLTITATDSDGAADGLKSICFIQVFQLTSDSVVKMTVNNLKIDEVEDFAKEISEASNLDIRVISYAPISSSIDTALKQLSDSNDGKMIIFAYAFGPNGDIMKGHVLIDAITTNYQIEFSLIENENNFYPCESPSYGGWIAAVVILSIFLVIVIATQLVYYFWFKKRVSEPRRVSQSSSSKEIEENFYNEPGQSTPMPNTEVQSQTTAEATSEDDRVGGANVSEDANVGEIDEVTSTAERLNNRLLSILDDDSSDDRKNVSFKEYVERIEVLQEQK